MFKYLKELLSLNVNDYITDGPDVKINLIILAITLGICIGTVVMGIYKHNTVLILKQLIRHEAVGEEKAKTLKELRLSDKRLLKYFLSRKGQITLMIGRVGEKQYTYDELVALQKEKGYKEEKIDFEGAAFYIRTEKQDKAKHVYENENTSPISILLYCVMFIAIFVILALLMPAILGLIESIIT